LPPLLQVQNGIAADAAVEELELELGEGGPVAGGGDKDVTVPEDVVGSRLRPRLPSVMESPWNRIRVPAAKAGSGAGAAAGGGEGSAEKAERVRTRQVASAGRT
jgi:hypothetical protein